MRYTRNPVTDNRYYRYIWCLLATLAMIFWAVPFTSYAGEAPAKASIYSYFRIAADNHPRISIPVRHFRQHMRVLKKEDMHAVSPDRLIKGLKGNQTLPANSIVITFEGAHRSILREAIPLLKKRNISFAIFIAPGRIDKDMPQYMSWNELHDLHKHKLATIGITLNRYRHGVSLSEKKRKNSLNRAIARYREEFGHRPRYFAYPYGEYDSAMRELVRDYGFRAAFGQHSGVAHGNSDLYALPRFTMTGNYGDIGRFRQTARALPLPVCDVTPSSPLVSDNPPTVGFSMPPHLNIAINNLQCYASNGAQVKHELIGETRVELRLSAPFPARRGRVNCIVPEGDKKQHQKQRWRWYGMLFVIPQP